MPTVSKKPIASMPPGMPEGPQFHFTQRARALNKTRAELARDSAIPAWKLYTYATLTEDEAVRLRRTVENYEKTERFKKSLT